MDVCRTCLSNKVTKDILELKTDDSEDNKNYLDIMLFCLDIEVLHDSKISTKLCFKCFKKILMLYKFKKTALKSDTYLRSLVVDLVENKQNEINVIDDIKSEDESVNSSDIHNDTNDDVEVKIEMKEEDDFISDDELLSVIKVTKYGNTEKGSKENAPAKKKKGRQKKETQKTMTDRTYQICDECGKTVRNITKHLQLHRPVTERKKHKCKMCEKTFASYSARLKHFKIKHLHLKQHCHICNKDIVSLKAHQKVVHENDKLNHVCVECDRRFVSRSALDLHMTVHTKVKAHECDICKKAFRGKVTLMMHKRQVHDKEKTHLCQFCSRSFFKKYHLQVHIRSHTKEKPFACSECGKHFSSTTVLKNHKMIHGEKQFDCTLCTMSFVKPSYLRNHMISHTKEKKHPCQYCGMKFLRQDHRKRHERTAHGAHQALFT